MASGGAIIGVAGPESEQTNISPPVSTWSRAPGLHHWFHSRYVAVIPLD
jgi:hypothetical protein